MGGGLDRGTEDDRLAADAEALKALEAQGADLSEPMPTAHALAFDSAEQAEAAQSELEAAGYSVSVNRSDDGTVSLEATKEMVLDAQSVTEERHTIEAVMDAYGASYQSGAIGGDEASQPITVKPTGEIASEFENRTDPMAERMAESGTADTDSESTETASDDTSQTYQVRDDLVINPDEYESPRTAGDTSTTIDGSRIATADISDPSLAQPDDLPHEVDVTAAAPNGTTTDRALSGATGEAITGSTSGLSAAIQSDAAALGGDALSGSRLDPLGLMGAEETADATPEGVDPFRMDRTSLYAADDENTGTRNQLPDPEEIEETGFEPQFYREPRPGETAAEEAAALRLRMEREVWESNRDRGVSGDPEESEEDYENPDAVDSTPTPTAEELAEAVERAESRGGTTQPSGDGVDIVGGDPELIKQRDELVSMPVEDAGGGETRDYLGSAPVVNPTGGGAADSSSGDDSPPPDDGPPPDDDTGPTGPPGGGGDDDARIATLAADDITGEQTLAKSDESVSKDDGGASIDVKIDQGIAEDEVQLRGDDSGSAEPTMKFDGDAIIDMETGQRADFEANDLAVVPEAEEANLGQDMEMPNDGD